MGSLAMSETSATSAGGKVKAQKQKGELDEQLRDYINEWRKQREKEEEELLRLKKTGQAQGDQGRTRKEIESTKEGRGGKASQGRTEKKAKEAEEKKKRLEEA